MSRHLKGDMAALFGKLSSHASLSGLPFKEGPRYLKSTEVERLRAKRLSTRHLLTIDARRAIAEVRDGEESFYAFIGFGDYRYEFPLPAEILGFESEFLLPIICDTHVTPTSSPAETVQVLDGPLLDESYEGHDPQAVASLFPSIDVWRLLEGCAPGGFHAVCLAVAAQEAANSPNWISNRLSDELHSIAVGLDIEFPFEELTRACFDYDPRHMYLALYKCLEAIYEHDVTVSVIRQLSLNVTWQQLASTFFNAAAWRPRESTSLAGLLKYADEDDLSAICRALNPHSPPELKDSSWASPAAGAIYRTRNLIAHYTSESNSLSVETFDWNEVCALLARIALSVRGAALGITELNQ